MHTAYMETGGGGRAYWSGGDAHLVRADTIGSVLRAAAGQAPNTCALVEASAERAGRRRWPVPGAEPEEQTLAEFCRARLAQHKVPRIWRFVDQFPVTGSGKIRKFALVDQVHTERCGDET